MTNLKSKYSYLFFSADMTPHPSPTLTLTRKFKYPYNFPVSNNAFHQSIFSVTLSLNKS